MRVRQDARGYHRMQHDPEEHFGRVSWVRYHSAYHVPCGGHVLVFVCWVVGFVSFVAFPMIIYLMLCHVAPSGIILEIGSAVIRSLCGNLRCLPLHNCERMVNEARILSVRGTVNNVCSRVAVEQWRAQFQLWSTIKEQHIARFTADSKELVRFCLFVVHLLLLPLWLLSLL